MTQETQDNTPMSFAKALEYIGKHHAKISDSLFRGVVARGEITFLRPGGKLFKFRKKDLDTWIEAQTHEAKIQTETQA